MFLFARNVFFDVFTSWQYIIFGELKPEKPFYFVALDEFSLLWQWEPIEDQDPSDTKMKGFKSPASLKRSKLTINSSDSICKLSLPVAYHLMKAITKVKPVITGNWFSHIKHTSLNRTLHTKRCDDNINGH